MNNGNNDNAAETDILDRERKFSIKDMKVIILVSIIAGVIGVSIFMINITDPVVVPQAKPELKPLSMDDDMLAEDQYERFKAETKTLQSLGKNHEQELSELREELDSLKLQLTKSSNGSKSELSREIDKVKKQAQMDMGNNDSERPKFSYPEPPNSTQSPAKRFVQQTMASTEKEELIGGVTQIKGVTFVKKEKKKVSRFYLPPSFMDATLLTGIDALTSKQGKDDIEQIFFRISTPAVLPNSVKQNFTGCFVVANGNGNLAKQRVQVRAVNLSCMSEDGKTYIDEKVIGFVTDQSDGKRDLVGNVVSKQGSQFGWVIAASIIGKGGESAALNSFETNQNVLGSTSSLNTSKIGSRSLGAAVQDSSETYKDLILEYLKQAGPVVEMGPGKKATMFLQEGVWLNVRQREGQGENNAS